MEKQINNDVYKGVYSLFINEDGELNLLGCYVLMSIGVSFALSLAKSVMEGNDVVEKNNKNVS